MVRKTLTDEQFTGKKAGWCSLLVKWFNEQAAVNAFSNKRLQNAASAIKLFLAQLGAKSNSTSEGWLPVKK